MVEQTQEESASPKVKPQTDPQIIPSINPKRKLRALPVLKHHRRPTNQVRAQLERDHQRQQSRRGLKTRLILLAQSVLTHSLKVNQTKKAQSVVKVQNTVKPYALPKPERHHQREIDQ